MKRTAAERLRAAIADAERQGVTRYAIARDAGLAKQTVIELAEGRTEPSLATAEAVAGVLGLDIDFRKRTR